MLAQALTSTLQGNITAYYADSANDGTLTSSSSLGSSFYADVTFPNTMDNVASSVSRYMRTLSDNVTVGYAHSSETYIKVQWWWITFPALLVLGGIVLLVLAISKTKHSSVKIWKSSSLPLLFHALHKSPIRIEGATVSTAINTLAEMEAEAMRINVRVRKSGGDSGRWMLLPIWSGDRRH
jgi:hypothetical protein